MPYKPEDLAAIGGIIRSFMDNPDDNKRLPKAVLVFMDGRCRNGVSKDGAVVDVGGDITNAPLPAEGDRCEGGAFYTDHPEGTYQGESMIQELDAELRKKFRLREPAMLEVDAE